MLTIDTTSVLMSSTNVHSPGDRFAFVHYSEPGSLNSKATRRLIHQHSMKDIGKSRRRPKRGKNLVELDTSALQSSSTSDDEKYEPSFISRPSWWLGSASVDPFLRFPIDLDASARELVVLIFNNDDGSQRPLRDAWFAVGLADRGAFLQVLSNSALHLEALQNDAHKPKQSRLSIQYQHKAVRSISERLKERRPVPTDGLIGAVAGLVCHDDIIGDFHHWSIHLKGLREMVAMRGGIKFLEENETLRVTISWVELRGAFSQDLVPFFPLPDQWLVISVPPEPSSYDRHQIRNISREWFRHLPGQPGWFNIFETLAIFTLHTFPVPRPKDTLSYHTKANSCGEAAWTSPLIFRLLCFRPMQWHGASNAAMLQEACRLGALLFLVPLWRLTGVSPVFSEILVLKLRALLKSHSIDWYGLWKLKLWVLYLGAVEAAAARDRYWYQGAILELLDEQGIVDWEEGLLYVKEVLWVCEIFASNDLTMAVEINDRLDRVKP